MLLNTIVISYQDRNIVENSSKNLNFRIFPNRQISESDQKKATTRTRDDSEIQVKAFLSSGMLYIPTHTSNMSLPSTIGYPISEVGRGISAYQCCWLTSI